MTAASRPMLQKHARLQFDPVRGAWAVLSPEKVLWPNEIGLDILRRCDGKTTVDEIVAALAEDYDAEAQLVGADVTAFLQEWADNLVVKL